MKGDFTITCLFLVLVSIFLQPINQKNPESYQLFEKEDELILPYIQTSPNMEKIIPFQMEVKEDTLSSSEHRLNSLALAGKSTYI